MIPKLRAWDIDDQKMTQWEDLILEKDEKNNDWLIGHKEGTVTCYYHDQILMQSTGLFDKNGVEIFEGDILKSTDGSATSYGVVCFGEEFGYKFPHPAKGWFIKSNGKHYGLSSLMTYSDEVVGNIHENPELLEVSE